MNYSPSPKTLHRYLDELTDEYEHVEKILSTSAYSRTTMRLMQLRQSIRRLLHKIERILEEKEQNKVP